MMLFLPFISSKTSAVRNSEIKTKRYIKLATIKILKFHIKDIAIQRCHDENMKRIYHAAVSHQKGLRTN